MTDQPTTDDRIHDDDQQAVRAELVSARQQIATDRTHDQHRLSTLTRQRDAARAETDRQISAFRLVEADRDRLQAELTQQKKISDRLALLYLNDPGHSAGYADAVARLRNTEEYRHWWSSSPESVRPTEPIRGHLADYLETMGPDGPDVTKPLPDDPADDGLCGDCLEGRCHGGESDDDCGCDRHAASVEARS